MGGVNRIDLWVEWSRRNGKMRIRWKGGGKMGVRKEMQGREPRLRDICGQYKNRTQWKLSHIKAILMKSPYNERDRVPDDHLLSGDKLLLPGFSYCQWSC